MLARMADTASSASAQKACCATPKLLTFELATGGTLIYCSECRALALGPAEEPRKPTAAQQQAFARRNAQVLEQVLKILDDACVTRKELLYACSGYVVSVARATNQDPIERVYAEVNMLEVMRARLNEGGE